MERNRVPVSYTHLDVYKRQTEGYEVSGYDKAKTGEQTVTVTYEGKTATFKVTVKEAAVAPKLPYVDVVESDWFYDAAYYNYFAETVTGTDPTHFSPYEILPRAQFATCLLYTSYVEMIQLQLGQLVHVRNWEKKAYLLILPENNRT